LNFTTVTTIIAGLPIMWSAATGTDVMKRIAAPMVGGLFTSLLLELTVYPVILFVEGERNAGRKTLTGWTCADGDSVCNFPRLPVLSVCYFLPARASNSFSCLRA